MNIENIKARKSVRTYNEENISPEILERIEEFIKKADNPFNIPIELRLLDANEYKLSSPVIVGAKKYVAGKYKKQINGEVAFGYSFEKFVLYATEIGLGTVWIAGTMDRKAFESAMDIKEGEIMPAVTPIGYKAYKQSIRENIMRKAIKADSRINFDKLFFKNDFNTALNENEAGKWLIPLQMVRWAPSGVNRQPWRVVVEGDKIYFYEKRTKGYEKDNVGDAQKIDLGIALCHFDIATREIGLKGHFYQDNPNITTPENTEYIATFEIMLP